MKQFVDKSPSWARPGDVGELADPADEFPPARVPDLRAGRVDRFRARA